MRIRYACATALKHNRCDKRSLIDDRNHFQFAFELYTRVVKCIMMCWACNSHCNHSVTTLTTMASHLNRNINVQYADAFILFQFFKKAKAKGYGEHDQAAIYRAADL